jgi:hypothetical protein
MTPKDTVLTLIAFLIYLILCWLIFFRCADVKYIDVSDSIKRSMKHHGVQAAFEDDKGWFFYDKRGRKCSL